MVQTLLSLVALEVVIMTTYNATSDNKGGVMTMLGFAVLGFSLKSPAKLRRSMYPNIELYLASIAQHYIYINCLDSPALYT